jgi:hypothetical protein
MAPSYPFYSAIRTIFVNCSISPFFAGSPKIVHIHAHSFDLAAREAQIRASVLVVAVARPQLTNKCHNLSPPSTRLREVGIDFAKLGFEARDERLSFRALA